MGNDVAVINVSLSDIRVMGEVFAKSNLFGMKTAEQAIALMLVAQAEGRHPATIAMQYDVIGGRPALKSQAALMRFQEAGGKIKWITRTDKECSAEFDHPQANKITVTWNLDRAKAMGYLGKDNWMMQPMIMMQWRVVAEGVRACYPACLGGAYLDSEVKDFETVREPAKEVEATITTERKPITDPARPSPDFSAAPTPTDEPPPPQQRTMPTPQNAPQEADVSVEAEITNIIDKNGKNGPYVKIEWDTAEGSDSANVFDKKIAEACKELKGNRVALSYVQKGQYKNVVKVEAIKE